MEKLALFARVYHWQPSELYNMDDLEIMEWYDIFEKQEKAIERELKQAQKG